MVKEEDYAKRPVRSLQTMLRVIAADQEDIPSQVPDGIFGQDTERAVKAFQNSSGLTPDGVVNRQTWDAIVEQYDRSYANVMEPPQLTMPLSAGQVIAPGEANGHVGLLQAVLHILARQYHNLPDVAMTGVYDGQTQTAIACFKKLCGHSDDKLQLDRLLLRELFGLYRCCIGDGRQANGLSRTV